jgi:hypothetical protein
LVREALATAVDNRDHTIRLPRLRGNSRKGLVKPFAAVPGDENGGHSGAHNNVSLSVSACSDPAACRAEANKDR